MLRDQEQQQVGILVADIRRRIRQVVHAEARGHRLAPQQFWVLLAVAEAGSLSLGALSDRLPIDPPTASRVVASRARRRRPGGASMKPAERLSEEPATLPASSRNLRRVAIAATAIAALAAAAI